MTRLTPTSLFKVLATSLLLSVVQQPTSALQVSGLYNHQAAVNNESDSERSRAFAETFAAVVVKVTGERRWLQHPVIEQALDNAQSYVEAFSYASETIILPEQAATGDIGTPLSIVNTIEQRVINVSFAAGLIDELLASADIPVWDSNRPSVLVWMVLQNEAGERSLLTADSGPQIIELMQQFAEQRGLPIIFPVLDFEDRQNLSEDSVWTLDQAAISAASQRYGADSILAGRVHFTAGGELVGLWQFIFQDQAEVFDGFDSELQSYLYDPLDRITNQLANYFAIVPESSSQQFVRLRVEGIKNLSAYSALLSYVSNLGMVESIAAAELDGERLELQLGLLGDAGQLFELIALDRDLLPIESSLANTQSVLHYRWTR